MRLTPSQQQALDIDRHICVTAGAGSGKTTILVNRYLKILREGNANPQEIVAITFTEKAAAEMKERIIEELSPQEKRDGSEQDNSLQGFREKMSTAHISTIHAFCSRILQEFPFQAGVPANFSILQGIDQKLSLQQIITGTLKDIAINPNHPHRAELTRLLRRYGGQKKLVDFFATMINQRDVLEHLIQEIYSNPNDTEIRKGLQQQVHDTLMSAMDAPEFIRCLNAVLQVATGKNAAAVRDLTQQLEILYGKNPDSPEVPKLLRQIADPITIKNGNIAKAAFIGTRVDTTDIDTEINGLVSAAKKIKALPLLENEKDDDKTGNVENR